MDGAKLFSVLAYDEAIQPLVGCSANVYAEVGFKAVFL
jgi:hypothetical protein